MPLTPVMLGKRQLTRVLRLRPPFPSHKVNCTKQKNRLEIEPGNKEGLISFVSVLACLGFFFLFWFVLVCFRAVCRVFLSP